jgi:hypothetical protein
MIRFKCSCGQPYEVEDDRAGDSFQCEKCLRLLDVPGLGEINSLEEDGTLKMQDAPDHDDGLAEKMRVHGHHADLRQNVDEYFLLDDVTPADAPPTRRAPRYDPITGELIEEIELAPNPTPAPQDIPMATPTLNYASVAVEEHADRGEVRWWNAPWRIVSGMSLMAVFFVFLSHVLIHLFLLLPGINLLLLPFALLIALMIAAHYGNTMEEIGPQNHDEVPVLLRQVSFSQDIIHPLYGIMLAWLLSFAPLILIWITGVGPRLEGMPWIERGLWGVGMFLFPAAAFTGITSGATQNMLPHHVIAVIRAAPGRYAMAFAAFMLGWLGYTVAAAGLQFTSISFFTRAGPLGAWGTLAVGLGWIYGSIAFAVYFMHLAAVWMGLIYRNHHADFHWVFQQHEKRVRTDTLAQLQDMRQRGDPRLRRHRPTPEQLAAVRDAESERRAKHVESMRKL